MRLLKPITLVALSLFLLIACRSEETVLITGEEDNTLKANTNVATLMQRTSLNDGSDDNIIDNASCLNIKLPVTVVVNSLEIIVDDEEDFETIEDIFDASEDDDDSLQIEFPITIILSDHSEIVINNEDEFESFVDDCNGENEFDDDIECLDFKYPINVSVFNTVTEQTRSVVLGNDEEMHDFIDTLDDNDLATVEFPITLILFDGTEQLVNDLEELENLIDDVEDSCDEDDDYDYNDDDCEDCSTDALADILTDCSDWFVDKLEINDNDLDEAYVDYRFNFSSDGTISIEENGNSTTGSWSASGSGENITVIIEIAGLEDFNGSWTLHEIEEEPGEFSFDLRKTNDDRLRFESPCN